MNCLIALTCLPTAVAPTPGCRNPDASPPQLRWTSSVTHILISATQLVVVRLHGHKTPFCHARIFYGYSHHCHPTASAPVSSTYSQFQKHASNSSPSPKSFDHPEDLQSILNCLQVPISLLLCAQSNLLLKNACWIAGDHQAWPSPASVEGKRWQLLGSRTTALPERHSKPSPTPQN